MHSQKHVDSQELIYAIKLHFSFDVSFSVCLFVSVCLSVTCSICLSVCLAVSLSLSLSLSLFLSLCLSVSLSLSLSLYSRVTDTDIAFCWWCCPNVWHSCWSPDLDLIVNLDKSNIVVFRNGGHLSRNEKWCYGGDLLKIVNTYRYLGTLVYFSFHKTYLYLYFWRFSL